MIKADIILRNNDNLKEKSKKEIANEIILEAFINNSNVSTRQIPTKIKFRESYPMTKNNKIDYKKIEEEKNTDDEITIIIDETNVSINSINIL